jgi:hypothetical protein
LLESAAAIWARAGFEYAQTASAAVRLIVKRIVVLPSREGSSP